MNTPLRVLLVEDSIDDAQLLERTLRQGEFDPTTQRVEDEPGLHAALGDGPWDVVITDHALPKFSAPAVLEILQRSRLDIPLIVLSGKIGEEAAVALMRAGAADFIPKNNLARLAPAITREVRDARSRADRRRDTALMAFQAHLLRAVGQAVVGTDLHGLVTFWNPAAERIYGWPAAEALGRDLAELLGTAGADPPSADIRAMLAKGASWQGERVVVRRDGTPVPLLTTASPAYDGEGRVISLVWVSSDITEIKQRERQLRAVSVLGQGLAETLDLPTIYGQLYQAVLALWPDSSGVTVARYDERRAAIRYVFVVTDGEAQDPASLPSFPYAEQGGGPQSRAIAQRQPQIIDDLAATTRGRPAQLVGSNPRAPQSGLYVPMVAKGAVTGVVAVQAYTAGRFKADDAELLSLIANTAAVAVTNAQLFDEASRRMGHLEALRDIDMAISSSLDMQVTMTVFLSQVVQQLGVDAVQVLLLSPTSQMMEHAGSLGFRHGTGRLRQPVRLGEGLAGRAALERATLWAGSTPGGEPMLASDPRGPYLAAEQFRAHYAAPLLAKGHVKGVLEVFHRSPLDPTPEWMDFLETLAAQAAIAVDQAELFNRLQESNTELSLAYDATIEGWAAALDLRDKTSPGHNSQRVAQACVRLAAAMGMPDTALVHARRGALLHDIGQIAVPDHILSKPGPLDEDEWRVMRLHPVYARDLLAPIAFLRPAIDIPYCHHERWDGSGYPRGLNGSAIPLAARVFAVADVADALSSDRPYRAAWPPDRVRAYLREQSGKDFDPEVVEVFLREG